MSSQVDAKAHETRKRANGVGEIIQQQAFRAAQIGKEGAESGAYFYPIKGIFYLLSHPKILQPLLPAIGFSLLLSLGVTIGLFATIYLPTTAIMAFTNGPLAFATAAGLVLSMSGTLVNALARTFFLTGALEGAFDQVLLEHNLAGLVAEGREVHKTSTGRRLGKMVTKPLQRFSPEAVFRYLISLPLNLIPLVGTVFFILYNGVKSGPGYHARYFQLKKMSPEAQKSFVHARRGAYSSFGATALALNLVPLASLFFTFTSQVGAALWACDEEKRGGLVGKLDEGAGAVQK